MDKYEFSLKMEQMKKLIHEEDYAPALRIAESIDWNRVRNTNLLTMAATVFEKNDKLEEAKEILMLALERAPVGKRLLYKLTELAVRTGNLDEAESYYYEYRQVDSEDIGNYVLQYMILKARHAPYDRQLQPLELFCQADPDEVWLYELATTYENANRITECVRTCDRIALLYGDSTYSLKALRLKMRYAQLTEVQQNLLYPRSTPAAEAAPVQPAEPAVTDPYAAYGLEAAPDNTDIPALKTELPAEEEDYTAAMQEAARRSDELARNRSENEDAVFESYIRALAARAAGVTAQVEAAAAQAAEQTAAPAAMEETPAAADPSDGEDEGQQMAFDFGGGELKVVEEEEAAAGTEAAAEEAVQQPQPRPYVPQASNYASPAPSMERAATATVAAAAAQTAANTTDFMQGTASAAGVIGAGIPKASSATIAAVEAALNGTPLPKAAPTTPTAPAAPLPKAAPVETPVYEEAQALPTFHMIVEAENAAAGLDIAVDELKRIHEKYGIEHASAKTNADKLNEIGLSDDILAKIQGKDFVIENAGNLDEDIIEDLYDLIRMDNNGTIVVLIDTPDGLDHIEEIRPELFDICDYISDIDEDAYEEQAVKKAAFAAAAEAEEYDEDDEYEDEEDEPYDIEKDDNIDDDDDPYEEDDEDYEDEDEEYEVKSEPQKRSNGKVKEKYNNVKAVSAGADGEQMEIDDFAQYCTQYATDIDCSITGKSMLALYERIELMEEDGIPLTRENAEQLIEDAADRAEKPPIGKRISGVFHSKYDKNGMLILKEEDFIF